MTAPWVAGKTYVPGSLVRPLTKPPAVSAAPTNAGFESGDLTGWTASAGWSVVGGSQYAGAYCAQLAAAAGDDLTLTNTNQVPITPGQVINCSLRVKQGAAGSGNAGALIRMHWYDASHAEIGHNDGDAIYNGGGSYKTAYLRAVAPTGAAFAAFGIGAWDHSPSHPMWVDDAAWDYTYAGPISGLIYKAVQPNPGKSGSNEPAWPPVNGETVVDNQVIWEAVLATRLVWQASPLMVSGTTEPDWPEVNGGTVRDGSIDWIAQTTQILDVNCPPSKIVAIAAGKVYAADNDIIRYCATVNPLDWTTQDDAGYLPFGLQTYGSNPVAAMGLYRSNLVAFNSEGFQMWQVDEDPASTALLDALPIGSTQNRALAPVANDLFVARRAYGRHCCGINEPAGRRRRHADRFTGSAGDEACYRERRSAYFNLRTQRWPVLAGLQRLPAWRSIALWKCSRREHRCGVQLWVHRGRRGRPVCFLHHSRKSSGRLDDQCEYRCR
jgi:hypothetical protein